MGKYANDTRNYNPEWEQEPQFAGWLCRNRDVTNKTEPAFCRVCRKPYRAHRFDLNKHAQTKGHREKAAVLNPKTQPPVTKKGVTPVTRDMKVADIILSVFVAMHCAIRCVDHLGEVAKRLGTGSIFQNLKLHRTKCSKLILNVVAPAMLQQLVSDINNSCGYSLIIDESTDVSVHKYMALCVKFFCVRRLKLVTEFLGLVEVHRATAEALADSTVKYVSDLGLDISKLIGIGTDGANNMCGKNNSLFTRLKSIVPNLELVNCVCHSLHLACCTASTEFPSQLESIIRDSRAWFECSPLRKSLYESFYKALNCGKMPKQLIKLVATRWLALSNAVTVVLDQWNDLKDHFNIVANTKNKNDKCHMARVLSTMFNNVYLQLYLVFLKPILDEVQTVNLLFQSENADPAKLFGDLRRLFLYIAKKVVKPCHFDALDELNFNSLSNFLSLPGVFSHVHGMRFGVEFDELIVKSQGLIDSEISIVKERCRQFLITLTREIACRIPPRLKQLESINNLIPELCSRQIGQPAFTDLPLHLATVPASKAHLESQWSKLPYVNWTQHIGKVPTSTEEFWKHAYNYRNAGGQRAFKDISELAFRALSLPISNATVERIFSAMNCIKTKVRNRLSFDMLVALLRIRVSLQCDKICCTSFQPSEEMLSLFNGNIYDYVHGNSASTVVDTEEEAALEEGLNVLAFDEDESDVIIHCV